MEVHITAKKKHGNLWILLNQDHRMFLSPVFLNKCIIIDISIRKNVSFFLSKMTCVYIKVYMIKIA